MQSRRSAFVSFIGGVIVALSIIAVGTPWQISVLGLSLTTVGIHGLIHAARPPRN
ncbi:hypothetical protein [Rathayibacter toxicus]|uniref:hypothetical protein n=1 Tax=Rathayibacter toxicus TaxID=145458 RepID=UPI0004143080|nr:hypothetical protein [Rathayibacter toxicus]QOD07720.1 hypothetical protein AYW78_07515 [Rathayibacter toxicus]